MQKRFSWSSWPKYHWSTLLLVAVGAVVFASELVFRLASLTYDRLSWSEILINQQSRSWHNIAANPLGGPLLVLERLTTYVSKTGMIWLRLPSLLAAFISIGLFYYITRRWFNRFTAVISTVLLATSALFLHVTRLATTDVLFLMAPLALLAYATYSARVRVADVPGRPLWVPLGLLAVGLYIPAFIWLLAVVMFIQPTLLAKPWQRSSRTMRFFSILLTLLLLVPLLSALVLHSDQLIRGWLGIAPNLGSPSLILHRLWNVPYNLFLHGPDNRVLWLGHVPIMPIAITVLIVLGAYELATKRRRQGILLANVLLVSWLICGIGGLVPLAIFVGSLFIVAAAGIRHLSDQWFRVFPRNPFARSLGYIMVALFCTATVAYGWHAYFVAWPYNPATQQVFIYSLADPSTGSGYLLVQ